MFYIWQRQALKAIDNSLSNEDVKRCFNERDKKSRTLRYWLIALPGFIGLGFFSPAVVLFTSDLIQFILLWAVLIIGLTYSAIATFFLDRREVQWLAEYFSTHGVRLKSCIVCGYDLLGALDNSTSCPECGAAIAAVTKKLHDVMAAEGTTDPPAEPGAEGGNG